MKSTHETSPADATSDATLVAGARRGDADAFAALFRRHAGSVRAMARRHGALHGGVDDICQEAFLRAYIRLESLREPERFRPWLLRMTRNLAIDDVRRRVRVRRVEALVAGTADRGTAMAHDPSAEQADASDLALALRRRAAGLSARDLAALRLAAGNARPAEIAVALDVTPGAAKVIVHRARRRLRAATAAAA